MLHRTLDTLLLPSHQSLNLIIVMLSYSQTPFVSHLGPHHPVFQQRHPNKHYTRIFSNIHYCTRTTRYAGLELMRNWKCVSTRGGGRSCNSGITHGTLVDCCVVALFRDAEGCRLTDKCFDQENVCKYVISCRQENSLPTRSKCNGLLSRPWYGMRTQLVGSYGVQGSPYLVAKNDRRAMTKPVDQSESQNAVANAIGNRLNH